MGVNSSCTALPKSVVQPPLAFSHNQFAVYNEEILRNLDIFVLDNSMRETTVAQMKGHVLNDKLNIFDSIQDLGITDFIVAVYSEVKSVDDEIASIIAKKENRNGRELYCFSECFDLVIDGIPSEDMPLGLSKMIRYGVAHVIIECDFFSKKLDFSKFAVKDFAGLITRRIKFLRENIGSQTRVLLNIRDALNPWFTKMEDSTKAKKDIRKFCSLLASLPKDLKLFGLMTEEPSGLMFPWQIAAATKSITDILKQVGWRNYHFLVHVHKGFGHAESVVMAALSNGATGIWCGVCEEGAITGHASSLMTLVNLALLGNKNVINRFNLAKMREAAIRITEITTGHPPNVKQEIYGSRAFDVIAQDMDIVVDIDPMALLGVSKETRISSIATSNMLRDRLNELFGEHVWDTIVLSNMRSRIYADLMAGKKYEYQSSIGLMNLYERAGGCDYISDMLSVIECDPMLCKLENHRLMVDLKEHFFTHCDMKIQRSLTTDDMGSSSKEDLSLSTPKEHVLRSVYSMHDGGTRAKSFALSSIDMTDMEYARSNSYVSPDYFVSPVTGGGGERLSPKSSQQLDALMALRRVNSVDLKTELNDEFDFPVMPLAASVATTVGIKRYSMSYHRFHETYLSNWMPNTRCQHFREMIKILDANNDGYVEWSELELRAKWALSEFSTQSETWQLDDFIQNIFETFVFAELKQPKKSLKLRSMSFSLHNSKTLRRHEFQFDKHDFNSMEDMKPVLSSTEPFSCT